MAFDIAALSGLASATPFGALGSALTAAASTPASSSAAGGISPTGPKSINVSGFGGRSSGSATQSLTQPEPDRGQWFPSGAVGDNAVPTWVVPAVLAVLVIGVAGAFLRRK